jgi:hypothetical protein
VQIYANFISILCSSKVKITVIVKLLSNPGRAVWVLGHQSPIVFSLLINASVMAF